MKTRFAFLALLTNVLLMAQTTIFGLEVNENNVSENQKVNKELSKTYSATKYFQQLSFDLASDLKFTLFNNAEITAKYVKTFTYSNGSSSAIYTIVGHPNAELVFSKHHQIITGMYTSDEGKKYVFHQTGTSIFAVSEVHETQFNTRDSQLDFINTSVQQKINSNVCLEATEICSATTIDVMVVYTEAAKNGWGGASQSNSFIATAITNFNTALINSGVTNTTINLVYTGEIAYTESGNISTDLSRLRTNNDTYMDDVHTLRTTYGADLCGLVTSTPTNTCGLGYLNTNPTNYSANNAFTVSLYTCVVSNYTLAHEMGHNMGLNHDWYVSTSTTPCSHHHGYSNQAAIALGTASTSSQRWRTIMAYNDECADAGFNCSRINRWANPSVNYNSAPTGIAIGNTNPSDEAFAFSRFACVVSQFAPTVTLSSVEISQNEIKDFTIFPNPAQDEINIWIKNDNKYTFKVVNTPGQIVTTTNTKTISLKGLSAGVYFLNIYSEKGSFIGSKKFIKK